MTVLVGYATSRGSTRSIAERVAARLQRRGHAAETRPVADVRAVTGFAAVVLGSAIHGGKWLPEAARFVGEHAGELQQRPVWLFSVSTLGDEESMFSRRAGNRLRRLRKETDEIAGFRAATRARAHRNFAGVIARSDWPATGRAVFRAMGGRYGDHRNWEAIDAWADAIASELSSSPPQRSTPVAH